MDSVSVFINGEPINEDYFGSAQSYLRDYFFAKAATIYAVPEGTNIELPDGILTSDYISIDLAFKNGTCYATEGEYGALSRADICQAIGYGISCKDRFGIGKSSG